MLPNWYDISKQLGSSSLHALSLPLHNQNNKQQTVLPMLFNCSHPGMNSHTVLMSFRESNGNYSNHELWMFIQVQEAWMTLHFAKF